MSNHKDETINEENAPPKVVPQITTVTNFSTKFPYLKKGEYDIWAMKMQNFISNSNLLCWNIVLKGNSAKSMTTDNDGNLKIRPPVTEEENQLVQREEKDRTILLFALPDEHMGDFYHMIDARDIWNAIKARFEEGLDKGYDKMQKILTQVNTLKIKPEPEDVNMKFLRGLPPSLSGYSLSSSTLSNAAFVSTARSSHGNLSYQESRNGGHTTTLSVSPDQHLVYEDLDQMNKEEFEEYDLKHQIEMLSIKVHRFEKKHGRKINFNGRENKYKSKETRKDGSDFKAMVVVDDSIDWDKQTEEGNTEPRSLENFGMIAGIKIESDADPEGEVVSANDAIPSGVSVSAGNVAAAVVSPQYETEFALMGLSTEVSIPVTCPLCCDSKYKLIEKDYQGQREQLNDYVVDLKATKNAVKILEKQIKCYQKDQLAYKEKIKVLSYTLEEKSNILEYRQKLIDQAAQEKQELMTKLDNEIANQAKWNNSGKNLYKLIDSSMSVRTKRGLGLNKYIREGELGIDDSKVIIFHTNSDELDGQPTYNRFASMVYGKKATDSSEIKTNDDNISHSNDSVLFDFSDRSSEPSTNDFQTCDSSRLLSVTITLSNKAEDPISEFSSSGIRAWTGLFEFADDTITDYSRPSPAIESTSADAQNKNPFVTETEASDSTILSKPTIKFVKAVVRAAESSTTTKVEAVKKSSVRYVKLYRKPLMKPNVRGNQRNWNNLKSHQLGPNFVMKKKACFNCGDFNHLAYDCRKKGKKNFTPRPATHRPYRPPMRPNMNSTRPNKPAHSYGRRPFQETTQELMIILIQRVQRMEKDLKARTSIHKVDRGRSRPVMAWVPKKDNSLRLEKAKDRGIVDSGCSRRKISGKGTIKTKNLNFENVLYVKELQHFNLISVSQICDQTHRVLFTENECLVLSKDFPLLDPSMVILSIPRKHNLYTFSLNELAPKGPLTYLIAKASQNESTLWHMRLGHVNFKNMNKLGIRRDYSNARTPQQNGVAERKNRTLIEAARTMLTAFLLPTLFWSEAVATACYVLNRVLVTKPHDKTPYELLTGDNPSISYLKPFSYHVTILNTSDPLGKFDKKSDEGYIVGYSISNKAYRVYKLVSRKIENTMNLKFLENKPFVAGTGQAWMFNTDYHDLDSDDEPDVLIIQSTPTPVVPSVDEATTQNDGTKSDLAKTNADNLDELAELQALQSTPSVSAGSTPSMSMCASRISADRHFISAGKNHVFAGRPTSSAGRPVSAGRPSGFADRTPIPAGRILGKFTPKPTTVVQAIADPDWVEAMQAKIQQFRNQKVWILVTLPNRKRAIGTKWILKKKRDAKGIVCRNKARLVAQGHRHEEGIDYTDVFTPITRIEAIRLFLEFASFMGFRVYQMDVKSAFLYRKIAEEVYVTQPRGFEDPDHPKKVYKVVKALYGLHQAARAWYERLSTFLLKHRYRRWTIDKTLFIKNNSKDIMLVQVYVDDIIFGSTRKDWCEEFETLMDRLQVDQRPYGIFIHQEKEKNVPDEPISVHLYRSMIGCLMYLTATRPDIMFAVCAAARHKVTPKTSNLLSVKWIFKYLTAYPKLGLWYPRDSLFDMEAFSNSDYTGANGDMKSTTGGCQFLEVVVSIHFCWSCDVLLVVPHSCW
nr:hypothetical protein [Tanacetum cinerariifolium]